MQSLLAEIFGGFGLAYLAMLLFIVSSPFVYWLLQTKNGPGGDCQLALKSRLVFFCGVSVLLILTGVTQIIAAAMESVVSFSDEFLRQQHEQARRAVSFQGIFFVTVGAVCSAVHNYWLWQWTSSAKMPSAELAFLNLRTLITGLVTWGATILLGMHFAHVHSSIWAGDHIPLAFILVWGPAWLFTNWRAYRLTSMTDRAAQ